MELDSAFQHYVTDRQVAAQQLYTAALTGEAAPYYDPSVSAEGVSRFSPDTSAVLPTDGLDGAYTGAREGGSSFSELGVIALQHSVISAARRDFGFRRRTRLRARAAALSRHYAMGQDDGPLTGSSLEYFKAMMEAEDA